MMRARYGFLTAGIVAVVVGVPLVYSAYHQTFLRNFRVVEDGVLYRSGQLSPDGFERMLHDYQVRTVVTLRTVRSAGKPFPDQWENDRLTARGLRHVRIIPRVWGPDEKGEIPAEESVQAFLNVMDHPEEYPRPVLVHCFAGIHRTGVMCALYRMEYQRWPVERALADMQNCGYDPEDMHEHIENYLRSYRPRWKTAE